MNNKIFARSIAAVMAVMMLGSVSFAASIKANVTSGTGNHTLNVSGLPDQTQETIMAYYSADGDTCADDADIVVLEQAANLGDSYLISADKGAISEKKYLVVKTGGSEGNTGTYTIKLNDTGAATSPETLSIGGINIIGAKIFQSTFKANQGIKKFGFKVTDSKTGDTATYSNNSELSGDADFTCGLIFYNVPEDVTLTAEYFAQAY